MFKKELRSFKERLDPFIFKNLKSGQNKDFHNLITHQIKTGGKRLRPFMLHSTCKALKGSKDTLREEAAIEVFHNYSLLLDDIIDRGEVRRGQPTSWKKYGLAATLCSSSFYFSTILDLLKDTPDTVVDIFIRETKNVMEGEFIDVLQDRVTESETPDLKSKYGLVNYDSYLKMIKKKTAALFRASCGMGAVLADHNPQKALDFGEFFGISYQLRDDILDIFGDLNDFGKEIGKDIKERKGGNIILVFAIKENPKIGNMIQDFEIINDQEAEQIINLIEETNARKKAQDLVDEYAEKAMEELSEFPENNHTEKLFNLTKYIKVRKK